jgi:outer membrane protein
LNYRDMKSATARDVTATVAIALLLAGTMRPGMAQTADAGSGSSATSGTTNTTALPMIPEPVYTQPLFLRSTPRDFSKPANYWKNPIAPYTARTVEAPRLGNTPRLDQLLQNGKIYLSLSDAVTLALENNFDIAIARYNLDIADADLLRARAGATLRGVSTGLVTNTLGGTSSTITTGGGPGGTSTGSGGSGSGASGLVLSTNGAGPTPELLDPALTGAIELQRAATPEATPLISGGKTLKQNTDAYNFGYTQGFVTGTSMAVTYNNSRITSNNINSIFSPVLSSYMQVQVTQNLLQGFGWGINGRFIIQAKNDRRITDSAFKQQVLYTINQVENIYWALVSAYEDEQSKERALQQSKQLASDNRKQLQYGTLAPLDVVNADSAVASDEQALIASQTNLEYQQLVMKQAIARNLEDPVLANAPITPTDRVSLQPVAEENIPLEDLIHQADANNPSVEQSVLTIKNDEITLKAVKNGLLPTVNVYGFYSANALGGALNKVYSGTATGTPADYNSTFGNLFNGSGPDKGVGMNVNIPIRNRQAQADQIRSQLEYRQAQMRLQQIYTQIRIQVINGRFALTNDRAQVQAALAAQEYASQSLEAERKKYKLGASTTANVLQMQRNLATADNNVISATAAYAKDRAALYEVVADTLDHYGVSLVDATTGTLTQEPTIPGLASPVDPNAPTAPKAPAPLKPGTAPKAPPPSPPPSAATTPVTQ